MVRISIEVSLFLFTFAQRVLTRYSDNPLSGLLQFETTTAWRGRKMIDRVSSSAMLFFGLGRFAAIIQV